MLWAKTTRENVCSEKRREDELHSNRSLVLDHRGESC